MASLLAFKELERRKIVYLLKPSEIQQFKVLLLLSCHISRMSRGKKEKEQSC